MKAVTYLMRRCRLPLVCPWESFAQSVISQQYMPANVSGWMGQVPQQPVLRYLNSSLSRETMVVKQLRLTSAFELVLTAILSVSKLVPAQMGWESKAAKFLCLLWVADGHLGGSSSGTSRDHWPFSADSQSQPAISHPSDSCSSCGDRQEHWTLL